MSDLDRNALNDVLAALVNYDDDPAEAVRRITHICDTRQKESVRKPSTSFTVGQITEQACDYIGGRMDELRECLKEFSAEDISEDILRDRLLQKLEDVNLSIGTYIFLLKGGWDG